MSRSLRCCPPLLALLLLAPSLHAETVEQQIQRLEQELQALQQRIDSQSLLIEQQRTQIEQQLRGLQRLRDAALERERGLGPEPTAGTALPQQPVGQAPEPSNEASGQSTLSNNPRNSVTRERGNLFFEPTLSFSHSSSSRVAIEGFSIIPSVIIGLINVQETRRDTLTAALNFRYALSDRLEAGIRIPYIYRRESIRDRDLFTGTSQNSLVESDGYGLGDVDLSLHYKLTPFTSAPPYYTLNLRVKTTTGKGPFEVERQEVTDPNSGSVVGEFFLEQPTGSGFYSVEPSFSVAYPTDPAVLYGSLGYMWNLEHDSDTSIGRIDPGDAFNFSFGMGFAINENASFNLGYAHSIILKSKIENGSVSDTNFDHLHVGSLQLGLNYRLSHRRSVNLNLSVGATDDAPDIQLSFGLPYTF